MFYQTLIMSILFFFCVACTERTPVPNKSSSPGQVFVEDESLLNRTQSTILQIFEVIPPPNQQQRATGTLTTVSLGQPVVNNAIGEFSLSNNAPLNGFLLGETVVVWSAVDSMGNTADAVQTVNVTVGIACSTSEAFFNLRVWPVLDQFCMECHNANKVTSALNFVDNTTPDYLIKNYQHMKNNSVLLDNNNESVFLNKASNKNNDHGGEFALSVTSPDYLYLSSMIERFAMCEHTNVLPLELILLAPAEQLRKTSLSLAGRLPLQNEIDAINNAPSTMAINENISKIIDKLFTEKAFYQRIKEIYNDLLLTNAFNINAMALGLPLNDFDNRNYFGTTTLMEQGYNGTDSNQLRDYANYGVSQAPLELISYVVKNDLPFPEILTADYVMVNPYSATIFSANVLGNPNFNFTYGANVNEYDFEQFEPARLIDNKARTIPHAGVFTTLPFLNRYPSSSTNHNRKRASYVFKYFLDTDIEGLADRGGLDLGRVIGLNPTFEDPQCKVCHDVLDPLAGLFKNWNIKGRYLGNNLNWFNTRDPQEMLAPGYNRLASDVLPQLDSGAALRWMAYRIAADNRFVSSTVKTVFKGFTGVDISQDPVFFQALKTLFINQSFNFKALVKEIVISPYFLAKNVLLSSAGTQINQVGMAHLLTPEQLERKIKAVFNGKQWRSPSKRNLLSHDSYLQLYGGIDSHEITIRTEQATSIIAGVQARIANQLACELVPADFKQPMTQRQLFPIVEVNHTPDNGVNSSLIKQNIQYLFNHILGQQLTIDDPALIRVYEMFSSSIALISANEISKECWSDMANTNPIIVDSLHTVRAWMAVVNYMLRDYYFLYE